MRRAPRFAAVIVAALVLAGCAMPGARSTAVPDEFTERDELPSCGAITLDQGEMLPDEAIACVEEGIGAEGAELRLTAPTTEGDPIITYYRALPEGGVELWFDARKDRHGDGWWHTVCPEATALDELGDCQEEHLT